MISCASLTPPCVPTACRLVSSAVETDVEIPNPVEHNGGGTTDPTCVPFLARPDRSRRGRLRFAFHLHSVSIQIETLVNELDTLNLRRLRNEATHFESRAVTKVTTCLEVRPAPPIESHGVERDLAEKFWFGGLN
jgi:hypothetical protein